MDLHASPEDIEVEFLFQLFDDALADVTEGSDVIGKDLHADGHENDLVFRQLKRQFNSSTVLFHFGCSGLRPFPGARGKPSQSRRLQAVCSCRPSSGLRDSKH